MATGNLEEAAHQPSPPASRERRPVLVFLRGDQSAAPISLEREDVLLGRALEADVRINDVRASRLHARILAEKNPETGATEYHIRDLSSTNGTFVNGHPVIDAALRDGDKLQIGDQLLRFEMLDDTEATVPGSSTAPPTASDRLATEAALDSAATTTQTNVNIKHQ